MFDWIPLGVNKCSILAGETYKNRKNPKRTPNPRHTKRPLPKNIKCDILQLKGDIYYGYL